MELEAQEHEALRAGVRTHALLPREEWQTATPHEEQRQDVARQQERATPQE